MAGTDNTVVQTDVSSEVAALRAALNQLIADFDTLVAKLNADAGVTDTNYATTTARPTKLTV